MVRFNKADGCLVVMVAIEVILELDIAVQQDVAQLTELGNEGSCFASSTHFAT